jgi:transposase
MESVGDSQLASFVIQDAGWSWRPAEMPRPLSEDLRERLVRAVSGGSSRNAAAKKFEVSVSAVIKLVQRWKATGSYMPAQIGGYRKPLLAAHADRVRELLAEKPDMSLAELKKRLAAAGIRVGRTAISRFLRQLGYTYKKNGSRRRTGPSGRQARAGNLAGGSAGARPGKAGVRR